MLVELDSGLFRFRWRDLVLCGSSGVGRTLAAVLPGSGDQQRPGVQPQQNARLPGSDGRHETAPVRVGQLILYQS